MNDFLIKIYNAHSIDDEIKIKKEFIDSSFDNLEDCYNYYKEQYKFNTISVSPVLDDKEK